MNTLHAQFIAIANKGETASGLISLGKRLKARLNCTIGEPREVELGGVGSGWVLDAWIKLGAMSLKEAHQEASKIGEIYKYALE